MFATRSSSITQRIAGGRGSAISHVQQKVEVVPPPQPFYFNLELMEGDDVDDFSFWNEPSTNEQPSLKPGKAYLVLVSASADGKPGQQAVKSQSVFDLYLKASGSAKDKVKIIDPLIQVEPKEIIEEEFEHEFHLNVAEDLPVGTLTLELLYRRSKSRHKPRLVATLTVKLSGTYNPIDDELLDQCQIPLDAQLPPHSAILHVAQAEGRQIRLLGWGRYVNRPLHIDSVDPPDLNLTQFTPETDSVQTIRSNMRYSSRHNIELVSWLWNLHLRQGKSLHLIIADHTELGLCWEMLELDDNLYLGALATVVRWLLVPRYHTHLKLQVKPQQHTGQVIAYLDQEPGHTTLERESLNQLATRYYQTPEQLKQRLAQSLSGVGLIYLGSYGIFTVSSKHKMAMGSLYNPTNRFILLALEHLSRCQGTPPVWFVNASHSARLMRLRNKVSGLPEILLARLASAYIGTLGSVGRHYAAQIAQQILQAASTASENVSLAEILRDLRATAVQRLVKNDSQENQLLFIYTFMYVYYGNPLARLRLLPASYRGEGHE